MPDECDKAIVFLRGKRVYLRPLETDDLKRCQRWINDPETRAALASFLPLNEQDEQRFLERAAEDSNTVHLAIVLSEGDRHIGVMGLHNIRWKDRAAEFGIMIGQADCRGKGYGVEATRLMLAYAFETLNLNRVQLYVYAFHEQAIRTYEQAGFVREGVHREHTFVQGRYVDAIIYSILARDYFQAAPREQP